MLRLDMRRTHRLGMTAVMALEAYNRRHLDRVLYELVSLRALRLKHLTSGSLIAARADEWKASGAGVA